ncbi:Hypothetical protein A7982_10073 [Minicystis rosea]|nr:Hypothetical protein A7982_10073 [Minicystis rosea]
MAGWSRAFALSLGAFSLFMTACVPAELSPEGAKVKWSQEDPAGCRALGTLREAEGGGLRSYDTNKTAAEARLRNEAARLGANAMVLLTEVHGDSEEGAQSFATGVAGLSTPNPRCTNCVLLTARAYACELPAPVAEKPAAPPPAAPPIALPEAPPPAAPAAEPPPAPAASPPIIIQTPVAPPVIIIIQPTMPVAPLPER